MKIKQMLFVLAMMSLSLLFAQNNNSDQTGDKKKKDEKRFQFGIGLFVNSSDFNTGYENMMRFKAIAHGKNYSYPAVSSGETDTLRTLDKNMQYSVLDQYILKTMEYGIEMRILWRSMMIETDLSLLPVDYTDNLRSDISLSAMIGIRSPTMIMPYIIGGPSLNFSFANDKFNCMDQGNWQTATKNLLNSIIVTPGINLKTGLDLKLENFSIGFYYQFKVKDFNDIINVYNLFKNGEITGQDAFMNNIGMHSRLGIAANIYFDLTKKGVKK